MRHGMNGIRAVPSVTVGVHVKYGIGNDGDGIASRPDIQKDRRGSTYENCGDDRQTDSGFSFHDFSPVKSRLTSNGRDRRDPTVFVPIIS